MCMALNQLLSMPALGAAHLTTTLTDLNDAKPLSLDHVQKMSNEFMMIYKTRNE